MFETSLDLYTIEDRNQGPIMRRRLLIAVMIVAAAVVLFFGGWQVTYPDAQDPKNMRYVFWKAGLYNMSLSQATSTMVGDRYRDELVLGKARAQLQERFGPLVALADASPYHRACYENSGRKGKDVLFIAHSSWMVVFVGDKAVDLVLMKGC
jgi:hypothetical protein